MTREVCEHFNPVDQPCAKCEEKRKSEALFLADELEIPLGTVIQSEVCRRAAKELRRLYAELERCKQVCAATSEAWREEAALAEPVVEPVAWIHTDPDKPRVKFLEWRENEPGYRGDWIKTPLYAAPPQRPAEPVQEPPEFPPHDDKVHAGAIYWYVGTDGKYYSSNEVKLFMETKNKSLHYEPPKWVLDNFDLIPLYTAPPAILEEREACAQIADAHASIEGIAQRIAAEIRGRQR